MEQYFSNLSEDIRYEKRLIILLSIVEPTVLQQAKFTNDEIDIIRNLALEKLHRQQIMKKYIATQLLEKHFSN